jgi:hypothetical protein
MSHLSETGENIMGKPSALPTQASDNAAEQAQSHLPTELPPTPDVTLPEEANISPLGVAHLPDWLT